MVWKLSFNKCLNCDRNFINIFCFRQSSLNNLINYLLSVWIFWIKDFSPKFRGLSFNKIAGLHTVKIITVGNLDKFLVTGTPCSLISSKGKVRISFLTIFTNNLAVIILILNQEILDIFVSRVNVDFSQSIVKSWVLDSFFKARFQPLSKHSKFTSTFKFINKFGNRANSNTVKELFNINFITI